MSCSQIDPELDERLNDVDELIQSTLGFGCLNPGSLLTPAADTHESCCVLPTREFCNGSSSFNNPGQDKLSGAMVPRV